MTLNKTESIRCIHCHVRTGQRRKKFLCYLCSETASIRSLYGSRVRLGSGTGNHHRPLPATPTMSQPGSEERIIVLTERAERDELLWHPDDFRPE